MRELTALVSIAMLAFCLIATPAHAQATRTWVSGVGDDANPCSRTAACKTFAGAISKTATGGEINCLDPGGFGAVTITKSIIINCEGVIGGVLAAGTNGINVSSLPAGSIVYLKGLDIQGATTGLVGISFNSSSAGILYVQSCLIRGFNAGSATGISFTPGGLSELYVSDSFITDNGAGSTGGGIIIRPIGTASTNAVLSQIHVENNVTGILADGTGGTGALNLSIIDSTSVGSSFSGVIALTTAGHGTANVMVNGTTLSNNNTGVRSNGPTSTVRIGSSVVTGNNNGAVSSNGGTLQSYGNNQVNGNTTDGAPAVIALH
jgi:hypothetical protein